MSDVEDRLREALERLAPDDLSTQDLSVGAWAYHARVRRRQVAALAAACAVVLVLVGVAVSMPGRPAHTLPAGPALTPGQCNAASAVTPVAAGAPPAPVTIEAAWICPDGTPGEGDGWTLPAAPLSGRYAALVSPELWMTARCQALTTTPGPAFTYYRMQGADRRVTAFRSRDAACAGQLVLASYLTASADQQADQAAARLPLDQLPCRSEMAWTNDNVTAADPSAGAQPIYASSGIPLVSATLCLKPLYLGTDGERTRLVEPLAPREYLAVPLDDKLLTLLNADLPTAREGFRGNGECLGEGRWSYSMIARTQTGSYLMMRTGCLDELFILSAVEATSPNHYGFIPSAETTTALRTLVAKY